MTAPSSMITSEPTLFLQVRTHVFHLCAIYCFLAGKHPIIGRFIFFSCFIRAVLFFFLPVYSRNRFINCIRHVV